MILAPLEQFNILKITYFITITNFFTINLLTIFYVTFIIFFIKTNNYKNKSFYLIPNSWQKTQEFLTTQVVAELALTGLTKNNNLYFLILLSIFNFILFSNLVGLLPYSFTPTSHLYVTFYISISIFIGINITTIKKYKSKTLLLFFPSYTTIYLAFLLVPIELISYLAKPISLGMRLFINLMAGHTLLKVIIGFSWNLLLIENLTSIFLLIPMFTLIILFVLELGVALIQTYVFIVLTTIYIQDAS